VSRPLSSAELSELLRDVYGRYQSRSDAVAPAAANSLWSLDQLREALLDERNEGAAGYAYAKGPARAPAPSGPELPNVSTDPQWAVVPTHVRELRAITRLPHALVDAAQENAARQGMSFKRLGGPATQQRGLGVPYSDQEVLSLSA
jgi:hypothetical protein